MVSRYKPTRNGTVEWKINGRMSVICQKDCAALVFHHGGCDRDTVLPPGRQEKKIMSKY